jgi:hypothetical protein
MHREVRTATAWGIVVTLILAGLIILGSRNLSHFDAALIGYTFAILFMTFGITYRYAMWLQRPPTAMYWRRGWQTFFSRHYWKENLKNWVKRIVGEIGLNNFIWPRSKTRWLAHWLIMWGFIGAILITHFLVFGWLHFESVPTNPSGYRLFVFGFPTIAFPAYSLFADMLFHGLVWTSFPVMIGMMIAMRRRMRDRDAAALQVFMEDFFPLILIFAVALTGLLLTVSYTWLKGYAYSFLALLHAVTVILMLLWLPFGKFFHIFQRPAQIGVGFYKDAGVRGEPAACRRCGEPFTSHMHVEDLIQVERELGYDYRMDGEVEHYQWICPPCRRAMLALAQRRLWLGPAGPAVRVRVRVRAVREPPLPQPAYANPAIGEGPLGEEDQKHFHP